MSSAAKSRNKQDDGFGASFQSNININNKREINNTDEIDIPEIPDLEEQTDAAEDMAFQVAEAPEYILFFFNIIIMIK